MSLTGNLEDLPLLDIIQIVSFSKKTGYLAIKTDQGDAAIVFKDGAIIASYAWDSPPVDPGMIALPENKREAVVRRRIEMALQGLVRLRFGQFSFSLTDVLPRSIGGRSLVSDTLAYGLNAQELLLDLARGMDEDRRDSSAVLEASFAEAKIGGEPPEAAAESAFEAVPARPEAPLPSVPTPPTAEAPAVPPPPAAAPAAVEPRAILLVDDEEDVRRVLSDRFSERGYEVIEAEDPDTAVKKASRLGKVGVSFVLVTDLGMPTSGGASFQGGFEVVKRLWKMNLRPPILMMTESLSQTIQARARQMGIASLVFKPGLSKLDPMQFNADLRAFARKILADILPRLCARAEEAPRPRPVATPAAPRPPAINGDLGREFRVLQRHLDELRRLEDPSQVSTLVMRVAREFFERGILFLIKEEKARGLGGFGPAPRGENLNLLVREVTIPLSEPSAFLDAVQARKAWNGPLLNGKWGKYLLGKIGRFRSAEAALLPLLAHREAIALLFGDNPETGRDLGRLDALEVFINQAGIALENAFLQRKLQGLQKSD